MTAGRGWSQGWPRRSLWGMRKLLGALLGLALAGTLAARGDAKGDERGECQTHVRLVCPIQTASMCVCTGNKRADCHWVCVSQNQ